MAWDVVRESSVRGESVRLCEAHHLCRSRLLLPPWLSQRWTDHGRGRWLTDVRLFMLSSITVLLLAVGPLTDALASHYCQTVRAAGFVVKVRVQRGAASCREAKAVVADLFAHPRRTVRGWRCVGPQTGYSACVRGNSKITGTF